jgi:hypothetical protein
LFWRGYAEFCRDGDFAAVVLEEFAEAAFGFAVAVHGSDVEVADAGFVGTVEEFERVAAVGCAHQAAAAEAEAGGLAICAGQRDESHDEFEFTCGVATLGRISGPKKVRAVRVNEVCSDTSLRQNDWRDNSISESNSMCKVKRN